MHLTISALSHQIRGLEDRLGQQLFVRNPRGVTLTADGQRLFDRVADHLDAIELALRPFGMRRDDVLTLTLMPSFATSWLVPRLPRFVAAHPQLEIHLQSTINVVDFERDADLDAGLRYGPGHWPGLEAVHLFDDWLTPMASPALIERLGPPDARNARRLSRCSARPADAGPNGSSVSAGRCRSVTSPTSTTPRRCTARRSKAWASCSGG